MTRLPSLLDTFRNSRFSGHLIGYDELFRDIERLTGSLPASNYPPYNIINAGDNKYVIEVALAGFAKEDLFIEVENGVLSVGSRGDESDALHSTDDPVYLYRGLAKRGFIRSWKLAEHVEVESATMSDGILKVHLIKNVPEEKLPKKIEIN